jgi:hypothetical protein
MTPLAHGLSQRSKVVDRGELKGVVRGARREEGGGEGLRWEWGVCAEL